MKLQNVTMVVLAKQGERLVVSKVVENPTVAKDMATGKPVLGPLARRLLTVGEIAQAKGLSRNKAAELRRADPIGCSVPFAA